MTYIEKLLNDDLMRKALCALSIPEGLTDFIAKEICKLLSTDGLNAESFIFSLRQCNVITPRNREWSLSRSVRAKLHGLAEFKSLDTLKIHKFLLEQARCHHDELPSYLQTRAGLAYHSAAVGQVYESLRIYSDIAKALPSGEQWLAGILAEEQQNESILPQNAIEPAFLRGMSLYNDQDFSSARVYLGRVARSNQERIEVAIALHILGVIAVRSGDSKEGIVLFDQCVKLTESLGDNRGLAMVLNSRGCAKRNLRDPEGAIEDLTRAIDLSGEKMAAQALNSRASAKRDLEDIEGALEDLQRAEDIGDDRTRVMVLNSRSVILRDLGELENAIATIDELKKMDRSFVENVIDFEVINNRYKILTSQFERLSAAVEDSDRRKILCKFLLKIAKSYLGNYSDLYRAIGLLNYIATLDSEKEFTSRCSSYLGRAYLKLDIFEKAVEHFKIAIDAGEAGSELLASYAFSLLKTKVPLKITRPFFESAIRKNRNNSWAKSWFALALSIEGEHVEAERYAREAIDMAGADPNPIILFNLAQVLDAIGGIESKNEAIEVAKRAAEISFPTFILPRQFLAERGIQLDK